MVSTFGTQLYDTLVLLVLNNLAMNVPLGKCLEIRSLNVEVMLVETFRLKGGLNHRVFLCLDFFFLTGLENWSFSLYPASSRAF